MPAPTLGPCVPWITGADVAAFGTIDLPEGGSSVLDSAADEASMALYEISGRQFPGSCTRTVRPCADNCACWGDRASGLTYASWATWGWSAVGGVGGWMWRNECGDVCGCGSLARAKLPGYPVTEIDTVKIDGAVVDPTSYRLDEHVWLVRLDDPGPPYVAGEWPACQNLALDDSQPGTWSVTYKWGIAPPQLGKDAACQLAYQLYLTLSGKNTVLPSGVTKTNRQGVQIERALLANWFDPTKPTGLTYIDAFMRAYWRYQGHRRPSVWSPDIPQFARKVG